MKTDNHVGESSMDSYALVTFQNGDQVYVHGLDDNDKPVVLSTHGGGYNGAIRMTRHETAELARLILGTTAAQ